MFLRRAYGVGVGVVLAVLAVACSDALGPGEPDLPPGGDLTVTPKQDTLFVTDSAVQTVIVTALFKRGERDTLSALPYGGVKWTSLDTTIAVVNDSGRVRPRALGTTIVRAEAGGLDADASITVARAPYTIVVSTPTTLTGVVGDTVRVRAAALFPDRSTAPGVRLIYVSSNPTVATVDSTGLVRFLSAGQTTIRVTDPAGTASTPAAGIAVTSFALAVTTVDVGFSHSCGTVGPGRLYCWGLNNFGQLAMPTDTVCYPLGVDDEPLPCELSPKRTTSTLAFTSVTAGQEFSCGIVAGGAGYCWGLDTLGQLGHGRRRNTSIPSAITGAVRFAAIDAGARHACGIEQGASRAFCWGYDSLGQLGDATVFFGGVSSTTPIPVVDATQTPLPLTQVAAGGNHSCGIVAGGAAWCWGDNTNGQLGTTAPGGPSAFPRPVVGGLAFISVSVGRAHSCGLLAGGQAYCWGDDGEGQLGRGVGSGTAATPVAVVGGLSFVQLSAGRDHTCAITAAGTAYCWGSNAVGQSGRVDAVPSTAPNPTPIPVAGGLAFTRVSAGDLNSWGVVATPAQDAGTWCWGGNFYGALGNQFQAATRGAPVRAQPLR